MKHLPAVIGAGFVLGVAVVFLIDGPTVAAGVARLVAGWLAACLVALVVLRAWTRDPCLSDADRVSIAEPLRAEWDGPTVQPDAYGRRRFANRQVPPQ